jgi:hypothetical protein
VTNAAYGGLGPVFRATYGPLYIVQWRGRPELFCGALRLLNLAARSAFLGVHFRNFNAESPCQNPSLAKPIYTCNRIFLLVMLRGSNSRCT